jgi:fructose-specific phosphotransferase system IIC component
MENNYNMVETLLVGICFLMPLVVFPYIIFKLAEFGDRTGEDKKCQNLQDKIKRE